MQTQLLAFDHAAALATAKELLAANEVIVAPTDTVYGVMARFDSPTAIEQLYIVKDRPPQKAIPVLIGDVAQLGQLTPLPLAPVAQALATRFWPGALTLVLPALPTLPASLTANLPTVGVRMPDHALLRTLLRTSGPLAATSANRSGQPETHTAAEVLTQLDGRVPLVLFDDPLPAPPTRANLASTVVDVTALVDGQPRLLRAGPLAAALQDFLTAYGVTEPGQSC